MSNGTPCFLFYYSFLYFQPYVQANVLWAVAIRITRKGFLKPKSFFQRCKKGYERLVYYIILASAFACVPSCIQLKIGKKPLGAGMCLTFTIKMCNVSLNLLVDSDYSREGYKLSQVSIVASSHSQSQRHFVAPKHLGSHQNRKSFRNVPTMGTTANR